MEPPEGSVSTELPDFTRAIPQLESAPVQNVSEVEAVIPDAAGVGVGCGVLLSSSMTQSALPAVSALVASNRKCLPPPVGGGGVPPPAVPPLMGKSWKSI